MEHQGSDVHENNTIKAKPKCKHQYFMLCTHSHTNLPYKVKTRNNKSKILRNPNRQTAYQLSNAILQTRTIIQSYEHHSCQAKESMYSIINTIEKMMSVQHFAKRLPYFSPISTSPSRETPDSFVKKYPNSLFCLIFFFLG